jgi:hypothetical protein
MHREGNRAPEAEPGPEDGDLRFDSGGAPQEYRGGRWSAAGGLLDELLGPDHGTPVRADPLGGAAPDAFGHAW